MSDQGWDLAEFRCGQCGTTILARTERKYVNLVSGHKAVCNADRPAETVQGA